MISTTFAAVARHAAAAISRRESLLALGCTALAATVADPGTIQAGNAGKKVRKTCKKQREQCRNQVEVKCESSLPCREAFFPSCEPFAQCNAGAGIKCIFGLEQ